MPVSRKCSICGMPYRRCKRGNYALKHIRVQVRINKTGRRKSIQKEV